MARLKVSVGLFGLAMCFELQACTTNDGDTAAFGAGLNPEDAKALLVECKTKAGAPIQKIRIYKAEAVVNDAPEDQADAAEADEEGAKEEAVEATSVSHDPNVQAVRIEFNDNDRGVAGRCSHTKPPSCVTADEGFRMIWPEEAKAGEPIAIKEKWLFFNKTYYASCKGQVL